jgi:hypothetical protein
MTNTVQALGGVFTRDSVEKLYKGLFVGLKRSFKTGNRVQNASIPNGSRAALVSSSGWECTGRLSETSAFVKNEEAARWKGGRAGIELRA